MKLILPLAALLGLAVSYPAGEPEETVPETAADANCLKPPQMAHIIFHAAPVQYDLTIPADGQMHPTNNGLNVNLIDMPDFNIWQCDFVTHQPVTMVQQLTYNNPPVNQYAVGPPQPIDGVTCRPTCIPTYSYCYRNNTYIGACCNGYCAGDTCKPWRNF
ncbi:hypothetical protein B0H66DRAFT_542531 [Apodospora peruviana]|uniref:Uncharacterized protein n=1 Tax=Apodospora peruviana TaxID=516989 RepID=A0AAE0MEZ2_9PEZI|nr:hypothetical protein B0H66DRAFT_542531 [Apodospora peruviana]